MLTKDLEINCANTKKSRQFASWRTIELAYKIYTNVNTCNRVLTKITEEHVIPQKIKKMRIKYATQIFSNTLAAYIGLISNIQGIIFSYI